MVGRLRHLDDAADIGGGLALGDQLLGSFELADDLIRCVPGAFLVESPAQSGRLKTLIHPGLISGVHVRHPGMGEERWNKEALGASQIFNKKQKPGWMGLGQAAGGEPAQFSPRL